MRLRPTPAAALSLGLLSAWLVLLFFGHTAGGALHLLLLVAAAVFPWRAMRRNAEAGEAAEEPSAPVETP